MNLSIARFATLSASLFLLARVVLSTPELTDAKSTAEQCSTPQTVPGDCLLQSSVLGRQRRTQTAAEFSDGESIVANSTAVNNGTAVNTSALTSGSPAKHAELKANGSQVKVAEALVQSSSTHSAAGQKYEPVMARFVGDTAHGLALGLAQIGTAGSSKMVTEHTVEQTEAQITAAIGTSHRGEAFWVAIIATVVIVMFVAFAGYFLFADEHSESKHADRRYQPQQPHSRAGTSQALPPRDAKPAVDLTNAPARQGYGGRAGGAPPSSNPDVGRYVSAYQAGVPAPYSQPGTSNLGDEQRISMESGFGGAPNILCPGLVVPHGNECILAVRATRAGSAPAAVVMDVLDLQGKAVLAADMRANQRGSNRPGGISMQTSPVITLRTTSPIEPARGRPDPGDGNVLATCRLGDTAAFGRSGTMQIYNGEGNLFGTLTKDMPVSRSSRWVFTASNGSTRLIFEGSYFDRTINVTDENNEQVAETEPWTAPFDSKAYYYKLKVVSDVDVGLMLCGVLSIERLETAQSAR